MAGDDGIAPPLKGSEPSVPLLYESPIEKSEVGIIGPDPLASLGKIRLKKPNELYCEVVSRNRSQFVIC